ncbi:unnamed protein product [Cylindrotheca closterium]|uniref:Uncharacterized protein n=1 Tax=Cylindrotheca closterium TaxID=2856 RepID=A0AAD2PXR6_9STRA|nr:unnamed protein product [Cylindrotheca closterium]
MPEEEEANSSVGPARSSSDTVTTIHSFSSIPVEDDHFSYVSGITMDDALAASDRLTLSDRHQYRLDPRLHSLRELERASDQAMGKCFDESLRFSDRTNETLRLSDRTNESRFSGASEGACTQLCPLPRRRLSMSYRSAYSRSSSSNLEHLHGSLDSTYSDHQESAYCNLSRSSSVDSCLSQQTSCSGDVDYRTSETWNHSSCFLSEDKLDLSQHFDENDESHSSFEESLHGGVLDGPEYELPLGGEDESRLPISHEDTAPRRNYHRKGKSAPSAYGYSRTGVSSQSLDLLDVFGDRCTRSH